MEMRIDISVWFASVTVLIYDCVCTLRAEISYVWPCPRSIGVLLFYLNRYLPFIEMLFFACLKFVPSSRESCYHLNTAASWLGTVGMLTSQLIIILRTYALWGRKRSIMFVLISLTLIVFGSIITVMAIQAASLSRRKIKPSRLSSPHKASCLMMSQQSSGPNKLVVFYLFICFCETIVVVLTIIKANQHLRQSTSSWVLQLYRNGIIYCICMLVLSLFNCLMAVLATRRLKPTLFPYVSKLGRW
ncbi:hypothetical protein B0H34DRAFT_78510 [Crassisporium funariophilum]|nr:hypothetical protein B0H34DRAFT_78510 [Crassisporium funariophilum]